MLAAAALLAVALAGVAAAASLLPGQGWALRAPGPALLLWQSLGLALGLLALLLLATLALLPHGGDHAGAALALLRGTAADPTWWSVAAGGLGVALLLRLVGTLLLALSRTLVDRRRHRRLLDVVATRNPLVRGASVVESDLPVAYCLPGLRGRLVVSQGTLRRLRQVELQAVVAHERAHLDQRHDLVVLPFVALLRTAPVLAPVRSAAREVALLVELLADDAAARTTPRRALAAALAQVAHVPAPRGGLAVADSGVLLRARRLLDPPPPLGRASRAGIVAAAGLVVALPPAGLLLPLL